MTIRPFAMPAGVALQPMTQELIAAEMMKTVPQWAKPKAWPINSKNGEAVAKAIAFRSSRAKISASDVVAGRKSGLSMTRIAKDLKCARRTVKRILEEEGME